MDTISIILIAIGLSMDSFAVSLTNGLVINKLNFRKIITIALTLAIFQGLMPLLGWYLGLGVEKYIKEIDHWLAFILLLIIGSRMIYAGVCSDSDLRSFEPTFPIVLMQSIATSIDAFIVGISFAFLDWSIIKPIFIIGITTLLFSLTGLRLGQYLGEKIGRYANVAGGLFLISIGTKVLIEHLFLQ